MQDFIYLHGVLLRHNGVEKYHAFVGKEINPESEKKAWIEFWDFIKQLPHGQFVIYYYGTHEPTAYRHLMEKYPTVIMPHLLDELFSKKKGNAVDLYSDVICNCTDWPLHSYSVKNIAMLLGFNWRDKNPSGADSIEWFNSYVNSKDESILNRILEYNEDDCRAMLVIKDKLQEMFGQYGKK
jgi:predicted RecB family nuclease